MESLNTDSSLRAKRQPTRSHCACVTQPSTTTVRLEIGKTIIAPLSTGFPVSNLFFGLLSTTLAHLQLQVRAWQSFHQFMDEKGSHGHWKTWKY